MTCSIEYGFRVTPVAGLTELVGIAFVCIDLFFSYNYDIDGAANSATLMRGCEQAQLKQMRLCIASSLFTLS